MELGTMVYCLYKDCHVVEDWGLRLTMEMGHVGVGPREDAGVGRKDGSVGIVAVVVAAAVDAVATGDERVDPRIPSSSRRVFFESCRQRRDPQVACFFFSSGHARSMRRQGVERGNMINNPDRTKLSGAKNEQTARSQTDSCQTIASASGAEVTGRSGRAACFVVPAG